MANKIITSKTQLLASTGLDLGVSDWIAVEQSRIDMFAEATGDHQWIHVDPIKAAEGHLAHGYLTLSLVNYFLPQLVDVQNISMGVNYGCDKVRFPNVVTAGSKVRGTGQIISVEEVKGSVQVITRV